MRGTHGDTSFKCCVEKYRYWMTPEAPVCKNGSQWSKADQFRSVHTCVNQVKLINFSDKVEYRETEDKGRRTHHY